MFILCVLVYIMFISYFYIILVYSLLVTLNLANEEEIAAMEDSLGLIKKKMADLQKSLKNKPNVASTNSEHAGATTPVSVTKEKTWDEILRGVASLPLRAVDTIATIPGKLYETMADTEPNAQQLEKAKQEAKEAANLIEKHAVTSKLEELDSELKSTKKRQKRIILFNTLSTAATPVLFFLAKYITKGNNNVDDINYVPNGNPEPKIYKYYDTSEQTNTAEYTAILVLVTIAALGTVLLIATVLVYLHSTTKRKPYQDLLLSI